MLIGTNLDSVRDFAPHMAFADCFRMARAWGSAQTPFDGKAKLDTSGNPLGDFGTVVHTGVYPVGGIYKLSFTGKADVSCPSSAAKIQNLVYDSNLNTTSADIILNENSQLFIAFKNVVGQLKNLSLIRPGCTKDQLFNPLFIESMKPYRVIRFMDWLQTNNSPIKTWADRKRPEEVLQSGPRGVCLEYCIELCNEVGADMWVNIPHQADDDYVTQVAALVSARLDPLLNVYVEYSNEVWNSIFSQTEWNHQQAIKDVAAGQTDLQNGPTDTNTFYWGRRRVAKRIAKIGEVFKSVISGDRVRPVLSTQAGDVSVGRAQLGHLAKTFTPISSAIYGLAIAPYFATQADDQSGATLQNVIDGLKSSVASNVAKWIPSTWDGKTTSASAPTPATLAKYYGVKFLFYECGQHMLGNSPAAQALDLQVQSTPEMGQCYADYFQGMDGKVDLACHFVAMSKWDSAHGFWGLTQSYAESTPKQKAVLDACAKMNGPNVMDQLRKQIADLQAQLNQTQAALLDVQSKMAKIQSKIESAKLSLENAKIALS